MFKTGNAFIDSFSKGIILLPLLPACIIFVRRAYQQETLNFLMILSLLNLGENIGLLIPGLGEGSQAGIKNIFSLLELIVLTQVFATGSDKKIRDGMNIFLIAVLAVFITVHLFLGADQRSPAIDAAQNAIVILLAMPGLSVLIKSDNIYLFHSPLFWITTGTLFYFLIALLMELIGTYCLEQPNSIGAEKMIFINIANLVRYFFYTLAALLYQEDLKKEEQRSF